LLNKHKRGILVTIDLSKLSGLQYDGTKKYFIVALGHEQLDIFFPEKINCTSDYFSISSQKKNLGSPDFWHTSYTALAWPVSQAGA